MGKYTQWVFYKGVKVLQVKASGLGEADYIAALEEEKQELLRVRNGPPVLTDLRRTATTPKTHEKAHELVEVTKAEGIPDGPTAVVGLSPLVRSMAKMFQRDVCFADSVEEGMEYLVQQVQRKTPVR